MKVDGKNIESIHTLGSKFDMDSVAVRTKDGKYFRLSAPVILEMACNFNFEGTLARKHTYLSIKREEVIEVFDCYE